MSKQKKMSFSAFSAYLGYQSQSKHFVLENAGSLILFMKMGPAWAWCWAIFSMKIGPSWAIPHEKQQKQQN